MHTIYRKRDVIVVRRYARKPTANGQGTTTDFDKYTDTPTLVELEIDVDRLFRTLGDKAARSISGRSVIGGGMVKMTRARTT